MNTDILSQFEVENASNENSTFHESFTVEQIRAHQGGQRFVALPCIDKETKLPTGRFFFACGKLRGYVSKNLAQKLVNKEAPGTVVVSHVISKEIDEKTQKPKFDGLMLHEEGVKAIHVW